MTQHPDVSEISDLTEGLLSPSQSADLRAHLDGCELCADVQASLEEIRSLLGTLPGAARMPADVAGRIDAALAAEALLDSSAPEHQPHGSAAANVSRETPPPPATANGAATDADAATAENDGASPAGGLPRNTGSGSGSGSGSVHGTPKGGDRPVGHARGATGPGRSLQLRRKRRAVLSAVAGVAVAGVSVLVLQTYQVLDDQPKSTEVHATSSADGSKEFSVSALKGQVQALISDSSPLSPNGNQGNTLRTEREPETRAPGTEIGSGTEVTAPVPPCVQLGTGRTDLPIAAEPGRYQGTAAYLVVLPYANDMQQVEAFVIDASCTSDSSTTAGKVLLTRTYPRR
ncbi:anti-sigma factor [Streptomyces sp. NPDC048057]|uniref:anti-sigma factor family protein n=1 Tax=Streptomyces sp. NPDC048057 TaxID=3155628 RepID=UPI0033E80D4C